MPHTEINIMVTSLVIYCRLFTRVQILSLPFQIAWATSLRYFMVICLWDLEKGSYSSYLRALNFSAGARLHGWGSCKPGSRLTIWISGNCFSIFHSDHHGQSPVFSPNLGTYSINTP